MSSQTQKTLKAFLGTAGAGIDESHGTDTLHDVLKAVVDGQGFRAEGMLHTAPTTPSAQVTGAGNTTWNVDIEAGVVLVGGVALDFGVQADFSIHAGSQFPSFDDGDSAISTIVAKNVAGTITLEVVKGAAAVTGLQVAPTDAEITAQIGLGIDWTKLAECTLNRTGDTTVTQSQDNAKRDFGIAVTVETG